MQSLKSERASGIASCPADVLLLVLELQSPAEWRTLCLVNRQFRSIAEPLLYSKLQWSWKDPKNPPPMIPFLRTVISRPELAAYVRNIQLEGETLSDFGSTSSISSIPVTGADIDREIEFIQRTRVSYCEFWIQKLCEGVTDAVLALLLAQLPNLRQLDIRPVFVQRSTLIERMSVSIRSLATFKWPIAHLPNPLRLKSLQLSSIREVHLIDILSVTKSLKKLSWELYYDYGLDDEFNQPIVDLDQIASALSQIPPTLTELNISANIGIGGNDCWFLGIRIKGSLHKMADLHHIKRLEILLAFLVGFVQDTTKLLQDRMPRNLEFLTLTYDVSIQEDPRGSPDMPEWDWEDWAILSLLQSWLGSWKSYTPCLLGITLIVESPEEFIGVWDSAMMCQLSDLSMRTGIQLDVTRRED